MPYVEGFGTYPFGEEWLFDAVIRSYLPVLEVARDLTMTVTPVLADQLEDAGVRERLRRLPGRVADRRRRSGRAPRCRPSAAPPARRSWRATGARWSCSTRPAATRCAPSREARGRGPGRAGRLRGDPRRAAAAGDPRGPAAAARRRHPLAPPPLRLGRRLLAAGVRLRAGARVAARRARRALVLRRPERPRGGRSRRWPRSRPRPARWRCRSTGRRSSWLWSLDGYPSDPAHAQFAGKSLRGIRIWKVGGGAYDPVAAAEAARRQAARVPRRRRRAPARLRRRARPPRAARLRDRHRAARPLVVGGADLARGGARRRRGGRGAAAHRAAGAGRARAGRAAARRLDLGRGQGPADLGLAARSPTSPGPRGGSSCACCGRSRPACRGDAAARAARELLAVQASDWAFLDERGQAGDYAFQRATEHAEAALEAIDSPAQHRPAYALARPGPEPRSPDGALAQTDDARPDPLLGVPAADRGRPRPPRAQALRGAGRARRRGPRADPRRRGVAGRGAQRRRRHPPHPRAEAARPTWASSSPGSSG